MTIDRRRFLTVTAATLSSALLAACNKNPERAASLLDLAERKNGGREPSLFRPHPTARDRNSHSRGTR